MTARHAVPGPLSRKVARRRYRIGADQGHSITTLSTSARAKRSPPDNGPYVCLLLPRVVPVVHPSAIAQRCLLFGGRRTGALGGSAFRRSRTMRSRAAKQSRVLQASKLGPNHQRNLSVEPITWLDQSNGRRAMSKLCTLLSTVRPF